jgi:hypothetical protein
MTTTSTVSTTQVELSWEINGLAAGSDLVVTRVYWHLRGQLRKEGSDYLYQDAVGDWTDLTAGDSITPFDQLTEQQVIEWIQSSLGQTRITELENRVIQMVYNQKNEIHNVEFHPLPWSN